MKGAYKSARANDSSSASAHLQEMAAKAAGGFLLDKNNKVLGLIVRSMEDQSPANQERNTGQGPTDPRQQLAAVYDAYAAGLYRYALMVLGDSYLAEDAVQQTFAKLAAMGDRISQVASCNGYLRTAVRNECYRIFRRRSQADNMNPESASILEPADREALDKEQQCEIEQALRSLPIDQREIVHMKVYEQMTFQQIADELEISINTAASRYRYAMDKLRRLLGPGRPMEGPHHD